MDAIGVELGGAVDLAGEDRGGFQDLAGALRLCRPDPRGLVERLAVDAALSSGQIDNRHAVSSRREERERAAAA